MLNHSNQLPPLWREKVEFSEKEAGYIWAFAFGDAPLEPSQEDRRRYRNTYNLAAIKIRDSGIVKSKQVPAPDFQVHAPEPWYSDDPFLRQSNDWLDRDFAQRASYFSRRAAEPRTITRKFVLREDLATLAASEGNKELFGKPTTSRETTKVLSDREESVVLKILSAIIKVKYGEGMVSDLLSEKSTRFSVIYQDICKYQSMDEKTVRKYLKKLPG